MLDMSPPYGRMNGADLSGADLTNADVTRDQLHREPPPLKVPPCPRAAGRKGMDRAVLSAGHRGWPYAHLMQCFFGLRGKSVYTCRSRRCGGIRNFETGG